MKRALVILCLLGALGAGSAPVAQAKSRPGNGHSLKVAAHRRAAARRRLASRHGVRRAAKTPPCFLMARARVALVRHRHVAVRATVAPPSCPAGDVAVEATNTAEVASIVECLVNRLRYEHGLRPLRRDPHLAAAAQMHGEEMIDERFFAHTSPDGSTITARDLQSGYIVESDSDWVLGENLAWGTLGRATPEAIVAAWEASPEHLANMLESRYVDGAVAVMAALPVEAEAATGATYVQEFGAVQH